MDESTESIEVSIDRIKEIIDNITNNEFTTARILSEYSGGFYSNKNTPPYYSFNAQFGKLLKRRANDLGITEIRSHESIEDNNGNPTSSSVWEKTN